MTYEVFARKYRPQTFDEVVGQQHVARTLKNAIVSGRVAHAYLFAGPRGVGKTSMARILAKSLVCDHGPTITPCGKCLNCFNVSSGQHVDVIEIDGASNRGIDEVRAIRDNTHLSPLQGRFKIYIIDEVHMLTVPAFNAILKTLEEPPPHVKFIFATTAPEKLPETVLSRCQRFDFRRIPATDIAMKLKDIANREKISAPDEVFFFIARNSAGGMRDAQSVLDQVCSHGQVDLDTVCNLFGGVPESDLVTLMTWLLQGDLRSSIEYINKAFFAGKDIGFLTDQLIDYVRDMLLAKVCGKTDLIERHQEIARSIHQQAEMLSRESILELIETFSEARRRLRTSANHLVHLEVALVRVSTLKVAGFIAIPSPADTPVQAVEAPEPSMQSTKSEQQAVPSDMPSGHSVSRILNQWPQILQKVREKSVVTYARLVEGKPIQIKDGKLIVGLPLVMKHHREHLSTPETRSLVEKCLGDVTGERYSLEFVGVERMEPKSELTVLERSAAVGESSPVRKARPDEKADVEPIIRRAVQIFDGRIVDVEG